MTQQFWHFHDRAGTEHTFGIYHGDESGHFVAYLDDRVMIIDFGILDDKSYHFYFERELLIFKIEKKDNGFLYHLNVDKTSDTELNLELKKEKREEIHIIILVVCIILIVLLSLYLRF